VRQYMVGYPSDSLASCLMEDVISKKPVGME